MAPQLEEVVTATHLVDAKHFSPDFRQRFFYFALGWLIVRATGQIRLRQRLAVYFAVGIQRQCLEHDHDARHHVVRQPLP